MMHRFLIATVTIVLVLSACGSVDPNYQGFNATRTFADGTQYIAAPDDTPMEHANRYPEQRAAPTVNDYSGITQNSFEMGH